MPLLIGGAERDRTDDLLLAKQALSQLSYSPCRCDPRAPSWARPRLESLVGLDGFEPSTPALSRRCSNQLSYRPASGIISPPQLAAATTTDKRGHLEEAGRATDYEPPDSLLVLRPSVRCLLLPRKEVIQPHLPIRLPCYDFTPVMKRTVVSGPLAVSLPTSGAPHSHGVTGGVYKTRERIHRDMLIRDY